MNILSNKTARVGTIGFFLPILVIGITLFVVSIVQKANGQHWPIPTNENCFNCTNCTFGELHGGLHFHGAIDIDHQRLQGADTPPIQSILHGKFWRHGGGNGRDQYNVIYHESIPGSGNYDRASVYMHITPPQPNFAQNAPIATGQQVGTTWPTRGHLDLRMWQLINGDWYAINPLKNEQGWSVAELRVAKLLDAQQPLRGYFGNAPIDQTDPQVNQVFITGIPQVTNNVASGYRILVPQNPGHNDGLTHFRDLQNNPVAARVHFWNRGDNESNNRGHVSNNITAYDAEHDQLVVFGNIVVSAHVRDQSINGGDIGEGLTVYRLTYAVGNQLKYDITFDQLQGDLLNAPTTTGDDEQIFHKQYNVWTGQDDNVRLSNGQWDIEGEYKYGNNDYIRLYNGGTAILNNCVEPDCPVGYLPPHKLIDTPNGPRRSNGVWFTKARAGTPPVFDQTPALTARCNLENFAENPPTPEALYPDGEHTLTFHVEDAAGRIDRAENRAEDNANVTVIVDNFTPFIQRVVIQSGNAQIYAGEWRWNKNDDGRLALYQDPANLEDRKADQAQPLRIVVTTSEPLALTTDHVS